ncbi:MAG: Y-family DNA polymerase [Planctomycetota bacterium]|jgi:DNA polymerase V
MKRLFALVDVNNFYASCEQVFDPALRGRAVVVLSNNDGIVVARSKEAKAAGIPMGVAAFKLEESFSRHKVVKLSSNYSLYADMSSRVMETLSQFTPDMEIYSIDEAFLDLAGFGGDVADYARKIRKTVRQWTGLPVSVGIGPTKTLAKLANKIAKKRGEANGVFRLTEPEQIEKVLAKTPVEDIWTVGVRTAVKLKRARINTAKQLRDADINWIKKRFGVVGLRTVYELGGNCCYQLQENPPARKSIAVSRSFGKAVENIDELKEAAASYAARAGEKLRQDALAAQLMTVFAATSRYDKQRRYFNSHTLSFETATSDTPELIRSAVKAAEMLFRTDCRFKKAGVILNGLVPKDRIQLNLFDTLDRGKSARLMRTIDALNARLSPGGELRWAAQGLKQSWQTKFVRRTKRYTTQWNELPEVA